MPFENSRITEVALVYDAIRRMEVKLRVRDSLLQRMVLWDALTGLRNAMIRAKTTFGVIALDVSNLQKVNDTLGHAMGNQLIAIEYKLITDTFKRCPVIRVGGDEFVVILQNSDMEYRAKLSGCSRVGRKRSILRKIAGDLSVLQAALRIIRKRQISSLRAFLGADVAMYTGKHEMKRKQTAAQSKAINEV